MFFSAPEQVSHKEMRLELLHSSENGFSEIYRADRDGKFRVLKCLKKEYRGNPVYESLLKKEFEIGYCLDHPNICQVIAFIPVPELGNCIEMEWIDGCTLEEFFARRPFDKVTEKKIISELCDALEYIHRKQVIHRDLKPENILVTHNGLNVKLIDFGLSDTDYHSQHKESAGTPIYASPELIAGEDIDARSDIYSLGRVIFEMTDRYTAVSLKCMEKRKEKRFSSTAEVKVAINRKRDNIFLSVAAVVILAISVAVGGMLFSRNGRQKEIDDIFYEAVEAISQTDSQYSIQ